MRFKFIPFVECFDMKDFIIIRLISKHSLSKIFIQQELKKKNVKKITKFHFENEMRELLVMDLVISLDVSASQKQKPFFL